MNAYIAVFDSGLGGLAVLRALKEAYPGRSFIFLADNAQLPLGDKPKALIQEISLTGARILSGQPGRCASLVIACGTSSSYAYPAIRDHCPCPVIEMIAPTARYLFSLGKPKSVGVLATAATVASGRYSEEIIKLSADCKVTQRAAPALVPLIEGARGSLEAQVAQELSLFPEDTEAFIMGCTHYTLIKSMVQALRPKALVIDSHPAVIENLAPFAPAPSPNAADIFLCTKKDASWEERAERLLGAPAQWQEIQPDYTLGRLP